jgi:hypothetical protein
MSRESIGYPGRTADGEQDAGDSLIVDEGGMDGLGTDHLHISPQKMALLIGVATSEDHRKFDAFVPMTRDGLPWSHFFKGGRDVTQPEVEF